MRESVKSRFRAFWRREAADRALVAITAPADAPGEADAGLAPTTPAQKWADIELRCKQAEHTIAHTRYFGEAFAREWVNFGPGALAAMIGGGHTWAWDTVWFGSEPPLLRDWDTLGRVRLDEGAEMYRLVTAYTQMTAERSGGRYVSGMSDLGGTLDIVASLRGTQELLIDLYDHPQEVKKAVALVDGIFETVYERLYAIPRKYGQDGMTSWIGVWNDRRFYPLQCDFSAMISPDAFAEFVMPSLLRSVRFLDNSIYHLDGPGELPHVDQLLSIERLDAIQWVSGDGAAPVWDDRWFSLYEKILKSGKNLILLGVNKAEHALKLLKTLPHRGLYIKGQFADAEAAAEVIIKAGEFARARGTA